MLHELHLVTNFHTQIFYDNIILEMGGWHSAEKRLSIVSRGVAHHYYQKMGGWRSWSRITLTLWGSLVRVQYRPPFFKLAFFFMVDVHLIF